MTVESLQSFHEVRLTWTLLPTGRAVEETWNCECPQGKCRRFPAGRDATLSANETACISSQLVRYPLWRVEKWRMALPAVEVGNLPATAEPLSRSGSKAPRHQPSILGPVLKLPACYGVEYKYIYNIFVLYIMLIFGYQSCTRKGMRSIVSSTTEVMDCWCGRLLRVYSSHLSR